MIILLTGGVIGPLSKVTSGLTVGTADIIVDTLAKICIAGGIVAAITLDLVAPVSFAIGVRRAETVFGTDLCIGVRVNLILTVLIDIFTHGVVPGIGNLAGVGVNMWIPVRAILEFMTWPVSFGELLLFFWRAFCCSTIATFLDCRAAQACVPSYHVC